VHLFAAGMFPRSYPLVDPIPGDFWRPLAEKSSWLKLPNLQRLPEGNHSATSFCPGINYSQSGITTQKPSSTPRKLNSIPLSLTYVLAISVPMLILC